MHPYSLRKDSQPIRLEEQFEKAKYDIEKRITRPSYLDIYEDDVKGTLFSYFIV